MKKLMILGGSHYILPVIKKAKAMGIYVITCDYLPDNFAHKYSDQYVNVSIIDKDAVLEVAKKLNIDGIMSFACDPGVVTAAYVADKLGLPSSGPLESIEILQNKGKFREFLKNNNFNVPIAKNYHEFCEVKNDIELFQFPIIVKPVDSAGSKGVTKVENPEGLEDAVKYALNFSHCDTFIIEEFIEQKDCSSDCDMFSLDGKLVFKSYSSQVFDKHCDNPFTPALYYWPSTFDDENKTYLSSEIQRLISLLGLTTAIYNIETRISKNNIPYIMEVSPRGGGNRLSEMINIVYGVDLIKQYICYSVGLPFEKDFDAKTENKIVEVILHSQKSGIFNKLKIDESIKNNVLELDLWINENDKVGGFKGANDTLGTLILKFNTKKEIDDFVNNINNLVKIELKE